MSRLTGVYEQYANRGKKSGHDVDKWRASIIKNFGSMEAWRDHCSQKAKQTQIRKLGGYDKYKEFQSRAGYLGGKASRKGTKH